MTRKTTDEQMCVLRFIYDYIKSNGCAPTRKEIQEALDITIGIANNQVNHLFVYGYLRESEAGQWRRNIALTEKGILACEGDE
jgi:Mn-dependent DtxR family transcriptional regulator